MVFGKFDPELEKKVIREEAFEEGFEIGFKEGFKEGQELFLKEQISTKLVNGLSCTQIADILEEDVETIQRLMEQLSCDILI